MTQWTVLGIPSHFGQLDKAADYILDVAEHAEAAGDEEQAKKFLDLAVEIADIRARSGDRAACMWLGHRGVYILNVPAR